MDTIAAKPITPPTPQPVAEAQGQREGKDKGEEVKEDNGFDKKLKKALKPDTDAPADGNPAAADAAAAVDPSTVVDPKAAAADPAAQLAAGAALPAAQALTARADGKKTGETTDVLGTAHGERASLERGAVERSAADRGGVEQNAVQKNAQDRREFRLAREADDRLDAGSGKAAASDAKDALAGAFAGSERAAAPAAAQTEHKSTAAQNGPSSLDALSSASMVQKWAAQAPANDAPAVATARIDTPLGAPGWADALQQKIVWLIDGEQQSAELHINPPNLGPVDVMLDLKDDGSTRVAFCSPHALVREVIESNMADLQSNLAQRGIDLSQTFVGADSSAAREQFAASAGGDGQGGSGSRQGGGSRGSAPVAMTAEAPARRPVVTGRGIVDTFA